MYTCTHCKNKFHNEPYISCTNSKKYCSLQCLPDNAMDKPYAFEYFNLIDAINDINSRISSIKLLEDRIEFETEVNELHHSTSLLVYGDDEGLLYKREIISLLSTLDKLYDKIHNFFLSYKYLSRPAAVIYCDELISIFGKDNFFTALNKFAEESQHIQFENVDNPEPVNDIYLGYSFIKLATDSLKSATELKGIMKKQLNKYKKQLSLEQFEMLKENDYYITVDNLFQCVVCREWEHWHQFYYSERLKLYQCNAWDKCSEFDDYYDED